MNALIAILELEEAQNPINSITPKHAADNNSFELTDDDWVELTELLRPLESEELKGTDPNLDYTAEEKAARYKYNKNLKAKNKGGVIEQLSVEENQLLNSYRRKARVRSKQNLAKNASISEQPQEGQAISRDMSAFSVPIDRTKRKPTPTNTFPKPTEQSNKRSKLKRP